MSLQWATGISINDFKNLKQSLDKLGKDIILELTNKLLEYNKVDTRRLLNSLDYDVLETLDGFLLAISYEDYFNMVDQGRKPGRKPPFTIIESWAKRKLNVDSRNLYIVTKRIVDKIQRQGIKPINIRQKTIESLIEKYQSIIDANLKIDIEAQLNKIFSAPNVTLNSHIKI
jgi:hypothetical protein